MKHFFIIIFILSFCGAQLFAQDSVQHAVPHPAYKVKHYRAGAYELIFSKGQVTNPAGNQFTSGLRFSGFYNAQEQYHFDFANAFGIFTGIGIRNVGMINYPAVGVEVKQRAYSLGVPLAIKLGNMRKRSYLALGAELEYFFNYKIKYFIDDKKVSKSNTWFPNQVNALNPSLFVELKLPGAFFIRAKYYLLNFLTPEGALPLPNNGTPIQGYSSASKLFYLSIGFNIKHKSKAPK